MTKASSSSYVNAALFWSLCYTAMWALLSNAEGWSFGIPTIVLATLLTLCLHIRPWYLRLWRLPGLVFHLGRFAAAGAIEVGRLAFTSRLQGQWINCRLQSEQPQGRVLLAICLSLIPGALATEIETQHLRVQVLDRSVDWQARVARLDAQITALLSPTSAAKD